MKEKELLRKWSNMSYYDWGIDEYSDFKRNYKSVLREISKRIGFELHSFRNIFYSFSAVMKSNTTNQFYYISISDVRFFKDEWAKEILYRTMENEHDSTGGKNRYSTLENLAENLSILDKEISKNLEKEIVRQVTNSIEPLKQNTEEFDVKYA